MANSHFLATSSNSFKGFPWRIIHFPMGEIAGGKRAPPGGRVKARGRRRGRGRLMKQIARPFHLCKWEHWFAKCWQPWTRSSVYNSWLKGSNFVWEPYWELVIPSLNWPSSHAVEQWHNFPSYSIYWSMWLRGKCVWWIYFHDFNDTTFLTSSVKSDSTM